MDRPPPEFVLAIDAASTPTHGPRRRHRQATATAPVPPVSRGPRLEYRYGLEAAATVGEPEHMGGNSFRVRVKTTVRHESGQADVVFDAFYYFGAGPGDTFEPV